MRTRVPRQEMTIHMQGWRSPLTDPGVPLRRFDGLLHLVQQGLPQGGSHPLRAYTFALLAVSVASLVAVPLHLYISLPSLMLPYVLAVVVAGLRHGSGPALLAAALGLFCHNFFFTAPRFAFALPHEDDFYSLLFLSLIALVCGPVASRIRSQFIALQQSNRYLEALRQLGQDLSVAEDVDAVWEVTAAELRTALHAPCWLVHEQADTLCAHPAPLELPAAGQELVSWILANADIAGRGSSVLPASEWCGFPVVLDGRTVAVALIRPDETRLPLSDFDSGLITAVLRQAAATLGRIRLSRELEHTRFQAEIEQLRAAMLSSVSHDLKSPLAAIMGAAESLTLLDRQLTPADRLELVRMIWLESHRLDGYIQNLLDMTRLENGALKLERDWVPVNDLVGSAMARLKRYSPEARLEYHSPLESPLLFVNPALFEQALFNIMENAVKYSPPGAPIVIRVEDGSDVCRIAIEDRGPGIPEPLLDKVFDMFYVIREGDHRKHGSGVGLAICRSMIVAHGGRVWAEQQSGGGTRFVVEVPVVQPVLDESESGDEPARQSLTAPAAAGAVQTIAGGRS